MTTEAKLATIRTNLTEAFRPILDADAKRKAHKALISKLAESIRLSFPFINNESVGGGSQVGAVPFVTLRLTLSVDPADVARTADTTEILDRDLIEAVEEWAAKYADAQMSGVDETIVTGQRFEVINGDAWVTWDIEVKGTL
jgi:hypothetical protein